MCLCHLSDIGIGRSYKSYFHIFKFMDLRPFLYYLYFCLVFYECVFRATSTQQINS